MDTNLIIIYATELLAILSGVYALQSLSLPYKLMLLQVVLSITHDLGAWLITHILLMNSNLVFNIYVHVELWIIGYACVLFINTKFAQRLILGSILAITIYGLISTYIKGIFVFNNWLIVITALFFIVVFILLLFHNSVFTAKKAYAQPLFLIAVSVILYCATIIPLFGLYGYLVKNDVQVIDKLFSINRFGLILRYSLVAIAFYLYARQAKRGYVSE